MPNPLLDAVNTATSLVDPNYVQNLFRFPTAPTAQQTPDRPSTPRTQQAQEPAQTPAGGPAPEVSAQLKAIQAALQNPQGFYTILARNLNQNLFNQYSLPALLTGTNPNSPLAAPAPLAALRALLPQTLNYPGISSLFSPYAAQGGQGIDPVLASQIAAMLAGLTG